MFSTETCTEDRSENTEDKMGVGSWRSRGGGEARTCLQVGQPRLGQRDVVCEEGAVLAGDQGWMENMHLQQTTQQDRKVRELAKDHKGRSWGRKGWNRMGSW